MSAFYVETFEPLESEINFDSFIKFPLFQFKLIFFDFRPLEKDATFTKKIMHSAKMFYYKLSLVTLFSAIFCMSTYAIVHSDDFVAASTSLQNAVSGFLIAVKALATFVRKNDIWESFAKLKVLSDQRLGENSKYKVKNYLDSYHRLVKVFAGIFLFVFPPMFLPLIQFVLKGEMRFTVNYWFPFDAFQLKSYLFALFWINWIGYNSLIFMFSVDSLLFALITVIAMEFDILKSSFSELIDDPQENWKLNLDITS